MVRIFFTKHARLRLVERGIKENTVRDIVEDPDFVYQAYDDKLAYRKWVRGKFIEVVCMKFTDKLLVITVYYV